MKVRRLRGEIARQQVFHREAALLAVRRRHARIGAVWEKLVRTLHHAIQRREHIAVVEDTVPRAEHPARRRLPRESGARRAIVRVLMEDAGESLDIVARTEIERRAARQTPVILHEAAQILYSEIRADSASRLPKRIDAARREIGETAELVDTAESIRHCRVEIHAIEC